MNGITLTRKSIVEAIGTFFLAVFGCGMGALLSVSNASSGLDITHYSIIVALTYGITYIILYYAVSGISGCFFNPAITLAMAVTKKISGIELLSYVIAEIIGATAGISFVSRLVMNAKNVGAATYAVFGDYSIGAVKTICLEAILVFILVLSFLGTNKKREFKRISGFSTGLAMMLVTLFGAPFTGTFANPSIAISAAFFADMNVRYQLWVFVLGAILGVLFAVIGRWVLSKDDALVEYIDREQ